MLPQTTRQPNPCSNARWPCKSSGHLVPDDPAVADTLNISGVPGRQPATTGRRDSCSNVALRFARRLLGVTTWMSGASLNNLAVLHGEDWKSHPGQGPTLSVRWQSGRRRGPKPSAHRVRCGQPGRGKRLPRRSRPSELRSSNRGLAIQEKSLSPDQSAARKHPSRSGVVADGTRQLSLRLGLMLERSLAIFEKNYGPNHRDVGVGLASAG